METVFNSALKFDTTLCGNDWIDSIATKTSMIDGSAGSIDTKYCHCGAGTVLSADYTKCNNCPSGAYQTENSFTGTCTPCVPGKFSTVAPMKTNDCKDCAIGRSQPKFAETFCGSCEPGRMQTLEGQADCLDCNKGQYRPRQVKVNGVMTDTELTKCK